MTEREEISMFPEELEAEKENLFEQLIFLDDGRTLELFYNSKTNESIRFYIRDQDGKLTEFTDLKKPNDVYDYEEVRRQIAEKFRITVTEKEAKEIAKKIYKRNVEAEMDQKEVLE